MGSAALIRPGSYAWTSPHSSQSCLCSRRSFSCTTWISPIWAAWTPTRWCWWPPPSWTTSAGLTRWVRTCESSWTTTARTSTRRQSPSRTCSWSGYPAWPTRWPWSTPSTRWTTSPGAPSASGTSRRYSNKPSSSSSTKRMLLKGHNKAGHQVKKALTRSSLCSQMELFSNEATLQIISKVLYWCMFIIYNSISHSS